LYNNISIKLGLLALAVFFSFNLVSASFEYCNPNLPGSNGCKEPTLVTQSTNYSLVNVNNSQYFQGYTPSTLGTWLQSTFGWITNAVSNLVNYYTKTEIDNFNASWSSTYNSTYDAKISFDNTNLAWINQTNIFTQPQIFNSTKVYLNLTYIGSACIYYNGSDVIGENPCIQ